MTAGGEIIDIDLWRLVALTQLALQHTGDRLVIVDAGALGRGAAEGETVVCP